jgi:hypothetical protein
MGFEQVALTDLNTPTEFGRGRSIARLSTGVFWVAYAFFNITSGLYEVRASHGLGDGTGWVEEVVSAPAGCDSTASVGLAVDSGDNLHLVYEDNFDYAVFYCQKPSGGAWTVPFNFGGAVGYRYPVVAIDAADNVVCVYSGQSGAPGNGHCWYRLRSAGAVWGVAEQVEVGMGGGGTCFSPAIAFDSVNNLHIVFEATGYGVNVGVCNIQYVMRSPAGVYTQIAVTDLALTQGRSTLAIGIADAVHLAWGTAANSYYTTKALIDVAFGAVVTLGVPVAFKRPSIAVDRAGNVYVVGDSFGGG